MAGNLSSTPEFVFFANTVCGYTEYNQFVAEKLIGNTENYGFNEETGLHEGIFYVLGAQTMTTHLQKIVLTAYNKEITFIVLIGLVTGVIPAVYECLCCGFGLYLGIPA